MASEILKMLTPEQLAAIPAGQPPKGVKSNLENPYTVGHVFYIVGGILMVVMYLSVLLRYYARVFVMRKFLADDWTTIFAVIGTTVYFGLCVYAINHAKIGTHLWDLSVGHLLETENLILSFLLAWTPAPALFFAKTSFFLMYLQLFHPFKWMRWAIYAGLAVNISYYTATLIVNIYISAPAPGQSWQEAPLSTDFTKTGFLKIARTIVVSLVIDVYLFFLPMVAIWKLDIASNKKFGVALVFATGFLACVASSLSVYFNNLLVDRQNDFTYYAIFVNIVTIIEMCVGITAACMPPCSILFKRNQFTAQRSGHRFSSTLSRPFRRSRWTGSSGLGINVDDVETVVESVVPEEKLGGESSPRRRQRESSPRWQERELPALPAERSSESLKLPLQSRSTLHLPIQSSQ